MRLVARAFFAAALTFAGPCFQLRIDTEVSVDRTGASRRIVIIETTDDRKIGLKVPQAANAADSLSVFALVDMAAESLGDHKTRWTSSRRIDAGDTARDLEFGRPQGGVRAGQSANVTIDDFIIFQRIKYVERIKDASEAASQDAVVRRVGSLLSQTLQRTARDLFGSAYDTNRLDTYLRGAGLNAFVELWGVSSELSESPKQGSESLLRILKREGIDTDSVRLQRLFEGTLGGTEEQETLGRTVRAGIVKKVASLLDRQGSTQENPLPPVQPEELGFLQDNALIEATFQRNIESVTGSKQGLADAVKAGGAQLFGCFGGAFMDPSLGTESIRWRVTAEMPGMILRTNGVPLRDGRILWLYLSQDLSMRQTVLEAESVVLQESSMLALGAKTTQLSPEDILELLAALGGGRSRTPKHALISVLRKAADGEAEALTRVKQDDSFDSLRKILGIQK